MSVRSEAYRVVCVLAIVVLCGGMALPAMSGRRTSDPAPGRSLRTGTPSPTGTPSHTARVSPPPTRAQLRAMKADELGEVPVVMYHRIVAKRDEPLDRTPAQLRKDLTRMAEEGYVPITAAAFVSGHIDVPAGKHPIVLTFDDSHPSQLSFGSDGRPTADSAIGVLLSVAREHPGFRPVATLFVIGSAPFQEGGAGLRAHGRRALRWLVAHGFEVGNHTMHHEYFRDLSADRARAEIADAQRRLARMAGIAPRTLAYPGGIAPTPLKIAAEGRADGTSYAFSGAFVAGAGPAPAPYVADFPRWKIPRIRGQNHAHDCDDLCLGDWLDRLADRPTLRYTSDGDPRHISFPEGKHPKLARRFRDTARPY